MSAVDCKFCLFEMVFEPLKIGETEIESIITCRFHSTDPEIIETAATYGATCFGIT